jgi:hypothetical protein
MIGNLSKIHFKSSGDFLANSFNCFKNDLASSGLLNSKSKLSDSFETLAIFIDSLNFLKTFKFIFHRAILACACVIFSRFLLKSCNALSIPNHIYLFLAALNVSLKLVAKSIFTFLANHCCKLSNVLYFSNLKLIQLVFSKFSTSE